MSAIEVLFDFNLIPIIFTLLSWIALGYIAFKLYTKQKVKLKLWKVLVTIIVGLFSFSINVYWFDLLLRLAILPLGVWFLYFILKSKENRWERYRSFVWLGFWSNYIFLAFALLSVPFLQWFYPKDQLSTYLSQVENPELISIHPAAKDHQVFQTEKYFDQLDTMKKDRVFNDEWYTEYYLETEPAERNERFPYQLTGTGSKWGSGLHSMIYVEEDGKGILVTTSDRQLYFRTDASLIDEGGSQ
ncbi:hypothetical protein [Sporosarcina newyorkensis]|uniref:Uncharacterized protein n=1 Tax=Sporosarcina newyorkensis TaxID=759851 RepID=A0A1T4YVQ6_9BACL|nr:hypothetical protein [Sporosarcina newyorkensis]SKB05335.1 hypothetical protein SAMN04244570_3621 [Sporosarcina newyorkensis]